MNLRSIIGRQRPQTPWVDGDELGSVLTSVGFERIVTHASLTGDTATATPGLFVLEASRPGKLAA